MLFFVLFAINLITFGWVYTLQIRYFGQDIHAQTTISYMNHEKNQNKSKIHCSHILRCNCCLRRLLCYCLCRCGQGHQLNRNARIVWIKIEQFCFDSSETKKIKTIDDFIISHNWSWPVNRSFSAIDETPSIVIWSMQIWQWKLWWG